MSINNLEMNENTFRMKINLENLPSEREDLIHNLDECFALIIESMSMGENVGKLYFNEMPVGKWEFIEEEK